ncbi:hypothetical protein AAHA92_09451 [Salvia divinorum]|uniref:Transcription repressor n=1 Tax=Salvia divinorum TaxID=28513 RepID=A0ABD1HRJ0_SALDI
MQKASPQNEEFPSLAADDDVQSGRISFENLRSFYRELCEEEMAKISRSPSFQYESPGPPRRNSSIPTMESESIVIVTVTYSRSPCEDFRRSMEGIVAARVESREEVDREFLEELLFRYLELNNDKFFGDILRAFLDLIGVWHEHSVPRRRRWNVGFSKKKLRRDIKYMHKLYCKYRC